MTEWVVLAGGIARRQSRRSAADRPRRADRGGVMAAPAVAWAGADAASAGAGSAQSTTPAQTRRAVVARTRAERIALYAITFHGRAHARLDPRASAYASIESGTAGALRRSGQRSQVHAKGGLRENTRHRGRADVCADGGRHRRSTRRRRRRRKREQRGQDAVPPGQGVRRQEPRPRPAQRVQEPWPPPWK